MHRPPAGRRRDRGAWRGARGAEQEVFQEAWRRTYDAVGRLAAIYRGDLAQRAPQEAGRLLSDPARQEGIARAHGAEALHLAQGVAGYGVALFKLAADLEATTDPTQPDPEAELFRRFMFLPYRSLRPALFQTMTADGWQRLSAAIEEAPMTRRRTMGWAIVYLASPAAAYITGETLNVNGGAFMV